MCFMVELVVCPSVNFDQRQTYSYIYVYFYLLPNFFGLTFHQLYITCPIWLPGFKTQVLIGILVIKHNLKDDFSISKSNFSHSVSFRIELPIKMLGFVGCLNGLWYLEFVSLVWKKLTPMLLLIGTLLIHLQQTWGCATNY